VSVSPGTTLFYSGAGWVPLSSAQAVRVGDVRQRAERRYAREQFDLPDRGQFDDLLDELADVDED